MGGSSSKSEIIYALPVGEKPEGCTKTYRNHKHTEALTCFASDDITTLQDVFLNSVNKYPNNNLLGSRSNNGTGEYKFKTYKQCHDIVQAFGTAVIEKKLLTQVDQMKAIGIFSKNREEWLLTEYSNYIYNHTLIPLYDTLGPESIAYVLNQTGLETIVASIDAFKILVKCTNRGQLKNIILMDTLEPEVEKQAKDLGLEIFSFWEMVKQQQQIGKYLPKNKVDTEDIFTFSYTSGTTGDPKGALVSHRNMTSICYLSDILETKMNATDVYCSYLPLPHVLERLMVSVQLYQGGSIGFYSGNVLKLKEDLALLKPTIFASVPRLYNKFYDTIKNGIDSLTGLKARLANKGLADKNFYREIDNSTSHKVWDKLVFARTKAALGGRVRLAATGGAPISQDVLKYLRVTLCVPIQEGYGSTETTGATFYTSIYDPMVGHVGGITPNMEFKLEDIPEMSYLSTDEQPRGEICIRGHAIFKGYFKLPEKTAESIDKDGWLHTGDVGQILPNGALKIIDRKKNLFKLAQGEYVAPEKIENIYVTSKYTDEVWIHGDSLQATLIAFAVVSKPRALEWAKENNVPSEDYSELLKNKDLRKVILKNLNDLGKAAGLHGFEQARNIYLEAKPFGEYNITTNTFKIKRKDARDFYAKEIDQLYNEKF